MTEETGTVELGTLEQWFIDSEDESRDARAKSEIARDYYDNIQLTTAEKTILQNRKQPPVVFNQVAPKIDFLLGNERQTRTDPKAYPRTPEHDEAADAVTDAIRYALDNNDFDVKASDVFENMLIEGTGGASVEVEAKGDRIDIIIHRFRWDRFGADPHSLARDYSDASYTFVISWKNLAEAKRRWPGSADVLDAHMNMASASETFDDKPVRWYNKSTRRVMCVDMYFKWKGIWTHAIFTKGVFLDKPKTSVYLDEDQLPENPHTAASAKVKRDGQRYGAVEALIDVQDEINKRRSKALHLLVSKQTFSKEGQITDINGFKKEANKPDGHLEFPNSGEFGKDFGVLPNDGLVGPQFMMYQDAMNRMDTVQANAALSGRETGDLSGRAIQSLQQGGLVELTPLFDAHAQWKKAIYRKVWHRIKQFWTEEKWIRVTDEEDNLRFVGLNQPISLAEQLISDETGMSLKEVRAEFEQEIQEMIRQRPELGEEAARENDVVLMDVDIIIDEVPDTVNLQSEQFDLLVKMYQANPEGIDWEDVVAMSTLRNKDKILNKDLAPEEQQVVDEVKEATAAADDRAARLEESEIIENEAKAAKDTADAKAQDIENAAVLSGLVSLSA